MTKFDQRKQKVGTQYNINVESKQLTLTEIETNGKQLLQMREYELVVSTFTQALGLNPHYIDAQYYIALALLNGSRPRLMKLKVIKEIEKRLQTAVQYDPENSHCLILWAIVKEDYYVLNGLYSIPPTPMQILESVKSVKTIHVDEILTHIQAPDNQIWAWLNKSK